MSIQALNSTKVRVFHVFSIWFSSVYKVVIMWQAIVNDLDAAHELIDTAISTALKESKPVYISISCNLPGIPHPTFARDPVPFFLAPKYENSSSIIFQFLYYH